MSTTVSLDSAPAAALVPPDLAEFETWVDVHAQPMVAFARRRLRDERLAEEAVQEAFLAAWRGRADFARRSSPSTWLHGILRRKIVDLIRRDRRADAGTESTEEALDDLFDSHGHYRSTIGAWGDDPARDYDRSEFWHSVDACLDGLPRRLAHAFVLRELDGLERDEICRTLGVSSSNYWVMLHRARLKLRDCLQTSWFQPEATRP